MLTLDPIKEIDLKNELKRKLWALDGILEHGFDVDAIAQIYQESYYGDYIPLNYDHE